MTLALHELKDLQELHGTFPRHQEGWAGERARLVRLCPEVVARYKSLTAPERLEIVAAAETFELLRAEKVSM